MSPLHRLWQALPRGLRREALFGGAALLAPRPARPEPDGAGPLYVAGYLGAATGLGEGARMMLRAMNGAGLGAVGIDLTAAQRQGPPLPERESAGGHLLPGAVPEGPGTIVLHVNGPMLPWALLALGRRAVAGKRLIAYWAWELPELPADWRRGYGACHRIWAPSRFCAEVFARPMAGRPGFPAPLVVPHPPPEPDPSPLGRANFGLPEGAFVGLSIFDATSSLWRKNPMAAIEAHRLAFGDSPEHVLVLKTHGTARAGAAWEEVARAAAARPNVRVLDAALPRRDLWALTSCCDVLVSLHRAEGYGLAIAEAMALGRPVVATGWSGNVDFMTGPGCFAVPWRLVPALDPQATYALSGAMWAEADLGAAAAALRQVAGDPALRGLPPARLPVPDYRAALAG